MVHDVCNCVIHGHSICTKLFVSSCGKSKGPHPRGTHNVSMCSSLGRRAKGPPYFAESNGHTGHTNHTRFMPDSYPNHTPPHSLPPIPHPGCFGGAWRGPLESLVEECICLVCPASNQHPTDAACLLPRRRVGPLLEVQLIQQYNFKAANHLRIIPSNHTPESYPESYPRIIPPIQTSRPDYGKKIHTLIRSLVLHKNDQMSCARLFSRRRSLKIAHEKGRMFAHPAPASMDTPKQDGAFVCLLPIQAFVRHLVSTAVWWGNNTDPKFTRTHVKKLAARQNRIQDAFSEVAHVLKIVFRKSRGSHHESGTWAAG